MHSSNVLEPHLLSTLPIVLVYVALPCGDASTWIEGLSGRKRRGGNKSLAYCKDRGIASILNWANLLNGFRTTREFRH